MDDAAREFACDASTQKQTFIAGISGTTIPGGVAVVVNSKGQLGVATSSARFKDNIQPMAKASEALLDLKPVTFRYKKELDAAGIPQFGLVAEDVAKVDPDLVIRDDSGKPFTVRYEAVNAMLLNEFLKAHRTIEAQSATIGSQQSEIGELRGALADLRQTVQAQAAQIQKVSAQVEAQEAFPRVVALHQ